MDVGPDGKGGVEVDKKAFTSYPGTLDIQSGTSVQLEAVPAPGYAFSNWSGSLSGDQNPATIKVDCTKNITAHFSRIVHTLTVHVEGNGATTPPAGEHTYADKAVVEVTAIPGKGWQFDGWIGNIAGPASASSTVTIEADMAITAQFSEVRTSSWWPISAIIGGVIVVGAVIWLVLRSRTV